MFQSLNESQPHFYSLIKFSCLSTLHKMEELPAGHA